MFCLAHFCHAHRLQRLFIVKAVLHIEARIRARQSAAAAAAVQNHPVELEAETAIADATHAAAPSAATSLLVVSPFAAFAHRECAMGLSRYWLPC
jgi:hypothetical protein